MNKRQFLDPQRRHDLDVIARFVTPGDKVLDLGCGVIPPLEARLEKLALQSLLRRLSRQRRNSRFRARKLEYIEGCLNLSTKIRTE